MTNELMKVRIESPSIGWHRWLEWPIEQVTVDQSLVDPLGEVTLTFRPVGAPTRVATKRPRHEGTYNPQKDKRLAIAGRHGRYAQNKEN